MRLLRRIHLFAGLTLLPWILLYGVTAFLFNHPSVWRSDGERPRQLAVLQGERAPEWAMRLTTAMGPTARLVNRDSARAFGVVDFQVAISGTVYDATYDVASGRVIGSVPTPRLNVRQFLTALHSARGYAHGDVARVVWAIVVDAMAALMIFWGGSGLFMWWHIRALRVPGTLVLVLSATAALAMTLAMHASLARP